jgi:hypothetical protein
MLAKRAAACIEGAGADLPASHISGGAKLINKNNNPQFVTFSPQVFGPVYYSDLRVA